MTLCGFCNTEKPYSGRAARLPQGGRAHICDKCASTGKYKVTYGTARRVIVESRGKFRNDRNARN